MKQKLMAVAVAGALAAPAAVMAQSTVQVYGNLYMEYAFTSQGRTAAGTTDKANADLFQTGGSEIGFKGEEKLGGGMSAWFQCNSTADVRGASQDGWCGRNSAVGLKGGFGNVFLGVWDTPFKRSTSTVGGRDTGVFGTAFVLFGNSTTVGDGASAGVFKRRQQNSINYDSPSMGGFKFMASTSTTNNSTGLTATAAEAKPRIWSLGAEYNAGPLELGGGYETHKKFYNNGVAGAAGTVNTAGAPVAGTTAVAATWAGEEHGYHLNAAYTLGNGLKIGGIYAQMNADTAPGATAKVKTYHIGAEWHLSGPHNVHFGYTVADDMKGTVGAGMGTRPTVTATGDTGAKMWQIRYVHKLSKRTTASIGYVRLKNDASASYDLGGLSYSAAQTGAKQSAIAYSLQHKF